MASRIRKSIQNKADNDSDTGKADQPKNMRTDSTWEDDRYDPIKYSHPHRYDSVNFPEQKVATIGRKYKKRRLPELSSDEVEKIIDSYKLGHYTQQEVARQFRVAPDLVQRLVYKAKKDPEKLRQMKQKEKERDQLNQKIATIAKEMHHDGRTITSC